MAAVNDVGIGMAASITTSPGESGDEAIPPSAPSKKKRYNVLLTEYFYNNYYNAHSIDPSECW